MSIELVTPSSHLILCRPLLLLSSIPPSIRVFSNKSTLRMRCLKYWSFSFTGRNINNCRYADDTTLMAESEEELKSLLLKVKVESKKVCLKLNIQKTKIMASGPITSWEIDGETVETVSDSIFGGLQNHCRW